MARIIAGLAALLVALCFATGALAHASLVSADPADGSVLPQPPKTLQLRFNESVTPAVVSLIDAAGKTRSIHSVTPDFGSPRMRSTKPSSSSCPTICRRARR